MQNDDTISSESALPVRLVEQSVEQTAEQAPKADQQPRESGWVNPRIPIRWRWTGLVGFAVTLAVLVLYVIVLDVEHDAWINSQAAQAELQVDRLTDEFKLPMLSGSSSETDIIAQRFMDKVPAVLGMLIRFPDGQVIAFGSIKVSDRTSKGVLKKLHATKTVVQLPVKTLWYAKSVMYDKTSMGTVAVRFSERAWAEMAGKLSQTIFVAAVLVVLFSSLLVYWIAGRMAHPIEMLAAAAAKVSDGDYTVQLPEQGNDELSDALRQFNEMVRGLAHKEELRGVFGRYLNPKLVSDVFESADAEMKSGRQEVSVLFADMVCFAHFSESTDTAKVVTVLNQYFELFHRIVTHYGGHVDKYIGDAVMAVFNHPENDQHHVRHAALAGLAMVQACQKLGLNGGEGEPIRFRVGLNSGQAIVGNIGAAQRLEYTVIGDAVNVASRMAGLGDGDKLIMSRHNFDLLGDGFEFCSIGMCDIKGISQPLEVGMVYLESQEARQAIEDMVDATRLDSQAASEGQRDA